MTVIEHKLAEKCDSYGLPHDFDTLMRHMENNHAAALGACRDLAESRRRKLEGAVDLLTIADSLAIGVLNGNDDDARVVAEGYRSARLATAGGQ